MKKYSLLKKIKHYMILCLVSVSLFASEEAVSSKPIDFSMVISGGVSLGAYESGYNWAIIKALSALRNQKSGLNPTLRSVTGASAGSINALLTAMYWCQNPSIPYQNSVEDNLFFETWVNLGIEDLTMQRERPGKQKYAV